MLFKPQDLSSAVASVKNIDFSPEATANLIACLDLTSLNESDTSAEIVKLCEKALQLPRVAAVCVYPQFVAQAAAFLSQSTVQVATVANFPDGRAEAPLVHEALAAALTAGAVEIDAVFPLRAYLSGRQDEALAFIEGCKALCGTRVLKVILEVGLIQDLSLIAELTAQVAGSGADFIKTSTGKVGKGASLEAAAAILLTIQKLNRPLGFKVAGGIREPQQALQYWQLARELMGEAWVTPAHFRIGASTLFDKLLQSL